MVLFIINESKWSIQLSSIQLHKSVWVEMWLKLQYLYMQSDLLRGYWSWIIGVFHVLVLPLEWLHKCFCFRWLHSFWPSAATELRAKAYLASLMFTNQQQHRQQLQSEPENAGNEISHRINRGSTQLNIKLIETNRTGRYWGLWGGRTG